LHARILITGQSLDKQWLLLAGNKPDTQRQAGYLPPCHGGNNYRWHPARPARQTADACRQKKRPLAVQKTSRVL